MFINSSVACLDNVVPRASYLPLYMVLHKEYDVVIGKDKTVAAIASFPTDTVPTVGVILAHGAGGDANSGNLPEIAETLAQNGYCCIRYTCKPVRLPYRVKACQVLNSAECKCCAQARPQLCFVVTLLNRWQSLHIIHCQVAADRCISLQHDTCLLRLTGSG